MGNIMHAFCAAVAWLRLQQRVCYVLAVANLYTCSEAAAAACVADLKVKYINIVKFINIPNYPESFHYRNKVTL